MKMIRPLPLLLGIMILIASLICYVLAMFDHDKEMKICSVVLAVLGLILFCYGFFVEIS